MKDLFMLSFAFVFFNNQWSLYFLCPGFLLTKK